MEMELERLYRYLKEKPRDARWMLRKVGADYLKAMEEMRRRGWTVECRLEDVNGLHRAVYCADLQGDLFGQKEMSQADAPRARRRKKRSPGKLNP
jgi:hypothetical protein